MRSAYFLCESSPFHVLHALIDFEEVMCKCHATECSRDIYFLTSIKNNISVLDARIYEVGTTIVTPTLES
jgi:hypothetical protein